MKSMIAIAFAVCTAALLAGRAEAQDEAAETARLRAEIAELRHIVEQLTADNERLKNAVEQLQAMNKVLAEKLNEHRESAVHKSERIVELEKRVVEAEVAKPADSVLVPVRSVELNVTYVAEEDATTISTPWSTLDAGGLLASREAIRLSYTYAGKVRTDVAAERVRLELQTRLTDGDYRSAKAITLTADGKATECEVVDYSATSRSSFGRNRKKRSDENLVAAVPREALARLAGAKKATMKVGNSEFSLSADQLMLFAAMDARLRATER